MERGSILVIGAGGIGCKWASQAHSRCPNYADLLLIDADSDSFVGINSAHCLQLSLGDQDKGTATLGKMALHRLKEGIGDFKPLLNSSELVIILSGLGGGTGSGVSPEIASMAHEAGSVVVAIAGLPFSEQPFRSAIAQHALPDLEKYSDVCIKVSMERLAWQARDRNSDWESGSEWIGELIEGLVTTLAKVGKINLDLMDLKTIVSKPGETTLVVGTGSTHDPENVVRMAKKSPLYDINVEGAKGCLIQVEGGPDMTLSHLQQVSEGFLSILNPECQVILGARSTEEMMGKLRLVAVLSGI
jgi:cell division protein FtsZ